MVVDSSEIAQVGLKTQHAKIAALLSLIPGFGQFYNKQFIKGALFFIVMSCFLGVFNDFLQQGFWGLFTLGTELPRDNSVFLLAKGVISVLIATFGLGIYYWGLRDAYLCGEKRDQGYALSGIRKQYQLLLSEGFPYLMITPGFILLVFVVVFPIIFGFSIAFTNYDLYHTPPAKLVDWIGLKNFFNIFRLDLWRSTLLDVLQWTVIWTLIATTLQCSVGVLLAILVNQKDLRFKALIRTILILPWAVPGFVTILVFAGMFNETFGVINNGILASLGIEPKQWMTDPFWTKTALILMQTWLGFPFVFAMTTGV
ncbi:carbohydrate ABC transporter permease, partial [Aeromonas salmonicida]